MRLRVLFVSAFDLLLVSVFLYAFVYDDVSVIVSFLRLCVFAPAVVYVLLSVFVCVFVFVSVSGCVYVCVCACVCIGVCVCVCACSSFCVCVCVSGCVCACVLFLRV